MTPHLKYIRRLGAPFVLAAALSRRAARTRRKADSTALGADTHAEPRSRAGESRHRGAAAAQGRSRHRAGAPKTRKLREPRAGTTPRPSRADSRQPPAHRRTHDDAERQHGDANPGAAAANAGGGAVGTIAAGTTLNRTRRRRSARTPTRSAITSRRRSTNAVSGSNGATIPAGATVNMTVTQLKRSENSNDKIVMEFAVNSVSLRRQDLPDRRVGDVGAVERVKDQPKSKDVQKVGDRRRGRRDRRPDLRQEHQGDGDRRRRGRGGGCRRPPQRRRTIRAASRRAARSSSSSLAPRRSRHSRRALEMSNGRSSWGAPFSCLAPDHFNYNYNCNTIQPLNAEDAETQRTQKLNRNEPGFFANGRSGRLLVASRRPSQKRSGSLRAEPSASSASLRPLR